MSLYGRYVRERENLGIVEDEHGFATYRFMDDCKTCYIVDIYIVPLMRKLGHAAKLADQIEELAKKDGCKYLLGSCDPTTNGASSSLKVMLAYGFELSGMDDQLIYLKKKIGEDNG